ncbi:MAG: hypothetical protein JNG90_00845 [Planctomycetaceae bacterium]|nr:hypothetical protein [Planctomycetaceae bacterium]
MNPINSISSVSGLQPLAAAAPRPVEPAGGPSFQEFLAESIRRLEATEASARTAPLATAGRADPQSWLAAERAAQGLRLAEQLGQRVAATIDELKEIRV